MGGSQAERRPEPGRPAKSSARGIPAVWNSFPLLHPANSSVSLRSQRSYNPFLRSHCLFLQLHVCDSFPFQAGAPEPAKPGENNAQDRSSPSKLMHLSSPGSIPRRLLAAQGRPRVWAFRRSCGRSRQVPSTQGSSWHTLDAEPTVAAMHGCPCFIFCVVPILPVTLGIGCPLHECCGQNATKHCFP